MLYRPAICGVSIILVNLMSAAIAQTITAVPATTRPTTQEMTARLAPVPMSVEGIVIDQSYKPIASAKVWLVQTNNTGEVKSVETVTDGAGRFKADGDSTMRMVVAHAPGFGVGGEPVVAPLPGMPAATTAKPTVVVLAPAAEVRVHVLDPDGKPASGVVVNLGGDGVGRARSLGRSAYLTGAPKNLASHFTQTTDSQGLCVFKDWPQDFSVVIDVADDRYAYVNSSEMVTIQRSATTEHTLKLEKASSISGKLTFADTKAPAPGIPMQLVPAEVGDASLRTDLRPVTTDAEGKYSFKRVPAGEYELMGMIPPVLASKYAAPSMTGINLPKGMQYEGVDFLLSGGVTVTGKVTARDTGAPVPNIRVSLRDPQSRYGGTNYVMTGADGVYSIHTTPGDRTLTVQPFLASAAGAGPTTRYAAMSRTLTATAEPMAPIDFQLAITTGVAARGTLVTADGRVISTVAPTTRTSGAPTAAPAAAPVKAKGTVVDASGNPVPYALIDLEAPTDPNTDIFLSGTVRFGESMMRADSEGRFEIPNITPGTLLHARTLKMATGKGTPLPEADADARLVVRPEAVGGVLVKVVDTDGKPVQGASIMIYGNLRAQGGMTSSQDTRTTGADGTWLFTPLASDFSYSSQVTAKGFGRLSVPLRFEPGKQAEQIVTLKRTDSFLAGMVLDEAGNPLPSARIRVMGQSGGNQVYAKTDEAGNFRVENLIKDENVIVYLMEGSRVAGNQRGVAGKDELLVIQRQATPTPIGARQGGGRGPLP